MDQFSVNVLAVTLIPGHYTEFRGYHDDRSLDGVEFTGKPGRINLLELRLEPERCRQKDIHISILGAKTRFGSNLN